MIPTSGATWWQGRLERLRRRSVMCKERGPGLPQWYDLGQNLSSVIYMQPHIWTVT